MNVCCVFSPQCASVKVPMDVFLLSSFALEHREMRVLSFIAVTSGDHGGGVRSAGVGGRAVVWSRDIVPCDAR